MGRTSGYRPTNATREEYNRLRAEMNGLHKGEWQKAQCIMMRITELLGKRGPSGGMVTPRSCGFCQCFGHTSQHCAKRKQEEAQMVARELRYDREFLASRVSGKRDLAWEAFIDWCNRRYEAACEAGLDHETGLEGWRTFQKNWELENPKPPCRPGEEWGECLAEPWPEPCVP